MSPVVKIPFTIASPVPQQQKFAQQPFAQQPFAQQPFVQQPFAQQPFAQQPQPFVQVPYLPESIIIFLLFFLFQSRTVIT